MRKIFLEDKTEAELRQMISNSSPSIREALSIVQSEGGEHYLIQDTDIVAEPLAVNIDEDGNQSLFID